MKRFVKILLIFFMFLFLISVLIKVVRSNDSVGFISPLSSLAEKFSEKSDSRLEEVVKKALEGASGNYGVVIKNLRTNREYSLNGDKIFESASLYKLWIMAQSYNDIAIGGWSEDKVIDEKIEVLNDKFNISSESAELTEGEISLSVAAALSQMITISHNYAALLLSEKIGLSSVEYFLKQNGFTQSKVGTKGESPLTSARDIALFFEKIYKGEIISKEYSDKMLNLLKQQKLNNKIPRDLPKGTIVAHKTGELGYISHDAGIVYGPQSDYIIVVLSESDYPPGAEDRIAQISKAVYDYFEK